MKQITDFLLKNKDTNNQVYNNCSNIVNKLPTIIFEKTEIEIYYSHYGTIIIEFFMTSIDFFSLEIGKDNIGYFSEISGITEIYCDYLLTIDENKDLINIDKLNNDLLKFLLIN